MESKVVSEGAGRGVALPVTIFAISFAIYAAAAIGSGDRFSIHEIRPAHTHQP